MLAHLLDGPDRFFYNLISGKSSQPMKSYIGQSKNVVISATEYVILTTEKVILYL